MSDNRIEGAGHKLSGSIKEGVGKLTGDAKLQAEGAAEKAGGSVQNAAGKVQDHVSGESRAYAGDRDAVVDHDRTDGAGKKLSGSIKEGIGKLTGDHKLQAEGAAEKTAGSVQNAVGGVKDAVRGR